MTQFQDDELKIRNLTEDETNDILKIKSDDITMDLLIDFFAYRKNKLPRFNPQDKMIVPANHFYQHNEIITTVGRFIVNTFLLTQPNLISVIGYVDAPFNKKSVGKIDSAIVTAVLENKITTKEYIDYLDKCQWLAYGANEFCSTSLNIDFMKSNKEVNKVKKTLLEQNKDAIANGDVNVITDIEGELIKVAKESTKDNPAFEIYAMGKLIYCSYKIFLIDGKLLRA